MGFREILLLILQPPVSSQVDTSCYALNSRLNGDGEEEDVEETMEVRRDDDEKELARD